MLKAKKTILIFLYLLTSIFSLANANSSLGHGIIGGLPFSLESKQENDFVVSVYAPLTGSHCGGTLINKRFVITAAHCVIYRSPIDGKLKSSEYGTVRGFTNYRDTGGQKVNFNKIYFSRTKPYSSLISQYDIAVIKLSSPFVRLDHEKSGRRITLAEKKPSKGIIAEVFGWGVTEEDGDLSDDLMVAKIPVVSDLKCLNFFGGVFCAGYADGGIDSCQGDSGGPLIIKKSNGDSSLAGIVSYGFGCARPNLYGRYTDVSLFSSELKSLIYDNDPRHFVDYYCLSGSCPNLEDTKSTNDNHAMAFMYDVSDVAGSKNSDSEDIIFNEYDNSLSANSYYSKDALKPGGSLSFNILLLLLLLLIYLKYGRNKFIHKTKDLN